MLKRLWLATTLALLTVSGLGAWLATPAAAEIGDSPQEGELMPYGGYQVLTWLERGQRRWYRLPYPGGGAALGITLHLRKEDVDVRDAVSLSVNIRLGEGERQGEANADWQGYGRIGFASTTANTGEERKFWLNNFGEGQMYYLLVRNESGRRLPIAITTRLNPDPSPYVLVVSDVPEPTPVPAPPPLPAPTPSPALPPPPPEPGEPTELSGEAIEASAELIDRWGNPVGSARLIEEAGGVRIVVAARDLAPGLHAIHLHAVGSCEPPSFLSAGKHFNPDRRAHGLENPAGPHAGDLPNVFADREGTTVFAVSTDQVTLSAGPYSLFDDDGTAIVIHALADDHWTDPAGNSGERIVCGVVSER